MPAVTVFSRLKGEPIATTHSPTRSLLTSPILTKGRLPASTLTTATSVRLSKPTMRALSSRLSVSVTTTSSAPSTTCALVMMKPSALKMKPEPIPRGVGSSSPPGEARPPRPPRSPRSGRLGIGIPKRRKNSSMLGSSSESPLPLPLLRRSVVRMLTTEGPTRSTSSVKSGNETIGCCARTGCGANAAPARKSEASANVMWRVARPAWVRALRRTVCLCGVFMQRIWKTKENRNE